MHLTPLSLAVHITYHLPNTQPRALDAHGFTCQKCLPSKITWEFACSCLAFKTHSTTFLTFCTLLPSANSPCSCQLTRLSMLLTVPGSWITRLCLQRTRGCCRAWWLTMLCPNSCTLPLAGQPWAWRLSSPRYDYVAHISCKVCDSKIAIGNHILYLFVCIM